MSTPEKIYLYPVWLRLWHGLNALLCLILLATGISMHFSYHDSHALSFLGAVRAHNVSGFILSVNYFVFFIGNLISENGKYYRVTRKSFFKRLFKQVLYYSFGMFRKEKAPFPLSKEHKFNPVQLTTYNMIMFFFVPAIILSGCIMYFPETFNGSFLGLHTFVFIDMVHLTAAFIILVFLIIHIYFSTTGHKVSSHYNGIITGWDELEE